MAASVIFRLVRPDAGGGENFGLIFEAAQPVVAPGFNLTCVATMAPGGATLLQPVVAPGFDAAVVASFAPGAATGGSALPVPPVGLDTIAKLVRLPEKDPRESYSITLTFPGPVSDVIMSVDSYSNYGVPDANPGDIFHGSYVINGATVTQKVRNGVDLVDYYIDCVATVGPDRLVSAAMLPVRTK